MNADKKMTSAVASAQVIFFRTRLILFLDKTHYHNLLGAAREFRATELPRRALTSGLLIEK
ncbi:hypothetical protein D7D26_06990 [Pyramidobacter sp. CG50-2]|nr:hypothetical protein D7D26_06990 [Pyramidobacter sp. CG50-2]